MQQTSNYIIICYIYESLDQEKQFLVKFLFVWFLLKVAIKEQKTWLVKTKKENVIKSRAMDEVYIVNKLQ